VLYSSFGNEVATTDISAHALRSGKAVFYPRTVRRGRIELVRVASLESLQRSTYGILEPVDGQTITPEELQTGIVFVPGVAFDVAGSRLGRGQGAYDRLLAQCDNQPKSVALAYEFQIVEKVPTDKWDRKVHYIITERRIIDCLGADPASLNRTC
jgi:5-formyltetrahydrofolate cyclo-ligase